MHTKNHNFKRAERNLQAHPLIESHILCKTVKHHLKEFDSPHPPVCLSPIVAYFQPQVWVATGELYGGESLARWNHHKEGVLGTEHFLPFLSSPRLQNALWERMLGHSLQMLENLRDMDLCISVNAGADIVVSERWLEQVSCLVAQHTFDAAHLTIEITESEGCSCSEELSRVVRKLRKGGVKCAIDDFGTGFSSLERLAMSPFSVLKVDRSIVHLARTNNNGHKILRNTIAMAHDLGLLVIAEGVESDEDLDRVTELRADIVQGDYYAKPMPAAEFITYAHAKVGLK